MQYSRKPNIEVTNIDNEIFLVEPESDKIYYLDEISSCIWRMLEKKSEYNEMVDTFAAAFSEIVPEKIEQDLAKVLVDMLQAGVITKSADIGP